MRIHADPVPDPGQKSNYSMKKIFKVQVIGKKKYTYEGTKAFLKGRKPGLSVNFGQFQCSWIRIRTLDTDLDLDIRQSSMRIQIRMHNTE